LESKRFWSVLLLCLALVAAGCGGDDDDEGATGDAKSVDPSAAEGAKGNVSWCIGKDTSGAYGAAIKLFSAQNKDITVKLVELPESADEQRNQLVQRSRAKSAECDVMGLDVIWTAEFAAQGWLTDVSDAINERKGDFIPSTLETAEYEGKYWGVPYHSNAGFVYYRTDQLDEAPATWEDLYEAAEANDGFVYQGARYEGLTVNFLELLYSAGGKVLSDDGQSVEIDSPEAEEALTFMVEGIDSGAAKKAVTTYKEEESRRAFESGNSSVMRNWPYAYSLGKDSDIADDFDIGNFPSFGGSEGASVLGGFNLGISAYSKNPEAALAYPVRR
jgi:multiple sugar transport system substrate-binding protein